MGLFSFLFRSTASEQTSPREDYYVTCLKRSAQSVPEDSAMPIGVVGPTLRLGLTDYAYRDLARDVQKQILDRIFTSDLGKRIPAFVHTYVDFDKPPREIILDELKNGPLCEIYFRTHDIVDAVCDIMRGLGGDSRAKAELRGAGERLIRFAVNRAKNGNPYFTIYPSHVKSWR